MDISSLNRSVKAADMSLEKLVNNTQVSQQDKVGEASRQFEAVLLRQILTESQKTVFKSSTMPQSTTTGIYQDMITNQLAENISRSGAFGLAHTLNQQLDRELKPADATVHSPAAAQTPSTL